MRESGSEASLDASSTAPASLEPSLLSMTTAPRTARNTHRFPCDASSAVMWRASMQRNPSNRVPPHAMFVT